ncbi:hypothetical protein DFH06DRAFT_1464875 [Mycena polygramma]|nr:hypothetical protein DFH06DRAFT_1464875 [Mycena polygramma]
MPHLFSKDDIQAQIETTEANIHRFTAQIDELDRARQKERRTLGRLWFMISPVGRLATELLVEIFALAIQPDSEDDGAFKFGTRMVVRRDRSLFGLVHPVHQTFILSHICSSWRHVVLNSPKLWTAGVVDVRTNGKNNFDIVRTLLDRSVPLPVSVSFTQELNGTRQLNEFHAPSIPDISQVVASTASWWKSLKTDRSSFDILQTISFGPFTALEDLNLQYGYEQSAPIDLFFRCPLLRRLIVGPDALSSQCDVVLHFPWAQLTHLDLVHGNPVTSQSILLQCTNLVSAILTVLEFANGREVTGIGRLEPFFIPLALPALEALDLTFFGGAAWPAQEFTAFQLRAPHIAQISLTYCPLTSPELITLLGLAPALTALRLLGCKHCLDRDFLQAFRYDETRPQPLVPQLQTLDLGRFDNQLDIETLEAVIRSRCYITGPDVARLQTVTIKECRISSSMVSN